MADDIELFNKIQCSSWLKEIGLSSTGTVEELRNKIRKYSFYPKLLATLKAKAKRNYLFECSLNPLEIPNPTAKWSLDGSLYPKVSEDIFYNYCSLKKEGNYGQQDKAFKMLQSRKIMSVKTLNNNDTMEGTNTYYVKAMIKKSYGTEMRPAVLLFDQCYPQKGHCSCPVGASGLCCHILALLLFLKHYTDTKEKILALSCTEQLQKWHHRSKKGSIPMIPLTDIKPKSAKMKKLNNGKMAITPADPKNSYFKRDVSSIVKKLKNQLRQEKPVEEHVYSVLMKSKTGRESSVGQHLHYKYTQKTAFALSDHNYCKNPSFDKGIIFIERNKINDVNFYIDKINGNNSDDRNIAAFPPKNLTQRLITQKHIPIVVESQTLYKESKDIKLYKNVREQISKRGIVNLDLTYRLAPKPSGNNYMDVKQNSEAWHNVRKFKITASRLPYLLGLLGKSNFIIYWDVVKNGATAPDIGFLPNIKRGKMFEDKALQNFETLSKVKIEKCGYFSSPLDPKYGCSPDGLGPSGIIVEVKTRAVGSTGPITSLENFPQYYIQCQLQMQCTDAEFCILQSYHPETDSSKCFIVEHNHTLLQIIKEVVDSIYDNTKLLVWDHHEIKDLNSFGKQIIGHIPDFELLKPLRRFIKSYSKSVLEVQFVDEIDFDVL
jgi:hypothetical protein